MILYILMIGFVMLLLLKVIQTFFNPKQLFLKWLFRKGFICAGQRLIYNGIIVGIVGNQVLIRRRRDNLIRTFSLKKRIHRQNAKLTILKMIENKNQPKISETNKRIPL